MTQTIRCLTQAVASTYVIRTSSSISCANQSRYCSHLPESLWCGQLFSCEGPPPMRALLAALTLLLGLLAAPIPAAAAETDLAAGKTATASSFTDVYRAANVTDGDTATYWESAN